MPAQPQPQSRLTAREVEARLAADLGLDRLLWLGDGLLNDHTDGHVDNLARFVARRDAGDSGAGKPEDPNAADLCRRALSRRGVRPRSVALCPRPGRIERDGEIVPASYMNFYIGNAAVVVPIYGAANDEAAVELIGALFPGREAVGLRADHVLTGGGSFHCISQQVPK